MLIKHCAEDGMTHIKIVEDDLEKELKESMERVEELEEKLKKEESENK